MSEQANLGLATTRDLLNEIRTRLEISGVLDYRTTDGIGKADDAETPNLPPTSEQLGRAGDNTASAAPTASVKAAEGTRVVRTSTSGDRVYFLDEVKKTRQWVTNPDVLDSLGFTLNDVSEVTEDDLLKYQMGPALYRRVDEGHNATA